MSAPNKRVLVPAGDGSEDIELSCLTDVLRRGNIDVTLASVMPRAEITLAHGLRLTCDTVISKIKDLSGIDAILIPGGYDGSKNCGASEPLKGLIAEAMREKKLYGAICAAPVLSLPPLGGLEGVKQVTCYPGMESMLPKTVTPVPNVPVVLCNRCLTSRGPGTAMYFGLAAVALLNSKEVAAEIAKALLIDHHPEVKQALDLPPF